MPLSDSLPLPKPVNLSCFVVTKKLEKEKIFLIGVNGNQVKEHLR